MLSSVNLVQKTSEFLIRKMVLSSFVFCHNYGISNSLDAQTKTQSYMKWMDPSGYNTNISIYNPLIKEKTKLVLQNANIAKWYSCGPTVYDSAHIGHAS